MGQRHFQPQVARKTAQYSVLSGGGASPAPCGTNSSTNSTGSGVPESCSHDRAEPAHPAGFEAAAARTRPDKQALRAWSVAMKSSFAGFRRTSLRDTAVSAICLGILTLGVCAQQASAEAASATQSTQPAATVAVMQHRSACELVTAREMSTALGTPMTAVKGSNERPPLQTECDYSSASGSSAYAELEVDWGQGELQAFKRAARLTGSAAPGSTDPMKGMGDAAYQVAGTQVFISTGGNLMIIRFLPGAPDVIKRARRIYNVAKGKL